MDARRTFELWRRVMRTPALRAAIVDADQPPDWSALGLDDEDRAILATLYQARAAAYWPCEGYRYRVIDLATASLLVGAPLTSRALANLGLDMRALAHDFSVADGWHDHGHYAYGACLAYLTYLRDSATLPTVPGLTDAIAVDAARCDLLRQVADLEDADWPRPDPHARPDPDHRYLRAPTVVGVATERAVTAWLQEPDRAGLDPLPDGPQYFLVYLPSRQVDPQYAVVGPRARALFEALERPLTPAEGRDALSGAGAEPGAAEAILTDFLRQGFAQPIDAG